MKLVKVRQATLLPSSGLLIVIYLKEKVKNVVMFLMLVVSLEHTLFASCLQHKGDRRVLQRMQDDYVDIQLTWPDVNMASRLCFDGPCRYLIKQEPHCQTNDSATMLLQGSLAHLVQRLEPSWHDHCFGHASIQQ